MSTSSYAGSAGSPVVQPFGHAVVIGAGMGGLIAANTMAKHAKAVTILERDALPADHRHRKGTPQGLHVHALLAGGLRAYDRAVPGFVADLMAAGAHPGDIGSGSIWFQANARHRQVVTGTTAAVGTRGLFEGVLRRRVAALPNVMIRDRSPVRDLTWNDDRTAVTGVVIGGPGDDDSVVMSADLVIDASGRGSLLPSWLAEVGYPDIRTTGIPVDVRYASRHFARRPDDRTPEVAILCVAGPESPRGGIAFAVEGDRWHVTLAGRGGDAPPADLDGFVAFASSLPLPDIGRIVATAEPIGDGNRYHIPVSTRRHYEHASRFPRGIIPIADSICAFTPVYGQGMSVAALEADVLDACLASGADDLLSRFMQGILPVIDNAWKLACGGDLPLILPPGQLPRPLRIMSRYLRRLHAAARYDAAVATAFAQVVHLNAPVNSLVRPGIVARVLTSRARAVTRFMNTPRRVE